MTVSPSLNSLTASLLRTPRQRRVGRIVQIGSRRVTVSGLSDLVSIGHQLSFGRGAQSMVGEVVDVCGDELTAMIETQADWLKIGDAAMHLGALRLYPDKSWLGRIIDSDGMPLDGRMLLQGSEPVSIDACAPLATERRALGGRLDTGYAVFDTVLPIVRGQRIGLFSGSGVGKSSLMAAFAREFEADVVVIAMVGERGREVREFVDRVLGKKGLARSVVVASTSDRSAIARRRAALSAMSIAEYFRDAGSHVLFMLDSVTRLAEAHREIATATGEPAAMRGYPPSMMQVLSSLTERAGPGPMSAVGDITAIMTVLVSGSDMEEPVADTLRGLLDGHFVLSRSIAERGRFPAIDVSQSVSRALPHAATPEEMELILKMRQVLSIYEESEIMIRAGLHQAGSDPKLDRA